MGIRNVARPRFPSGRTLLVGVGLAATALVAASMPNADSQHGDAWTAPAGEVTTTGQGVNRLDSYLLDDAITASGFGPTRTLDAQRAAAEAAGSSEGSGRRGNVRSPFRAVS